ncbi:MAG TPA: hypothetical protein VM577_09395 [Anaerovoracaceae bacterium]|nr:hypothetical protein [Anaerovoracaceae bacterium]
MKIFAILIALLVAIFAYIKINDNIIIPSTTVSKDSDEVREVLLRTYNPITRETTFYPVKLKWLNRSKLRSDGSWYNFNRNGIIENSPLPLRHQNLDEGESQQDRLAQIEYLQNISYLTDEACQNGMNADSPLCKNYKNPEERELMSIQASAKAEAKKQEVHLTIIDKHKHIQKIDGHCIPNEDSAGTFMEGTQVCTPKTVYIEN